MKSVLYVGAALMIGASIYGFVDYKKTSHDKKFTRMYDDEQQTPAVAATKEQTATTPVVAKEETKTQAPVTKTARKKVETVTVDNAIVEKPEAPVKVKKHKKIRANLFSRAPIREEVDLPAPPAKTEEKKTNEKEQ